jgi:hypothetical protein
LKLDSVLTRGNRHCRFSADDLGGLICRRVTISRRALFLAVVWKMSITFVPDAGDVSDV